MDNGTSQTENTIKEIMKTMIKLLKLAFKVVATIAKWVVTIISSLLPVLLPIIIVIVIVATVAVAISYFFGGGYDSSKGTVSSFGGVASDKFYGERFFYYDNEFTTNDLANVYLSFTHNILQDVENNASLGINLEIDFTTNYAESEKIASITKAYACKLAKKDSSATLLECTSEIKYYGFTPEQENIVFTSMAEYIYNQGISSQEEDNIEHAIKTIYESDSYNYSYMKNVCKKILIKDYLCNEEGHISNVERKNYFGLVFMQKQNVVINTTNIAVIVEGEGTVDISVNYNGNENNVNIETDTADSSWYVDGIAETVVECDLSDYVLNKFTAIDEQDIEYLKNGKTLFEILKDEKFNLFFKDTAKDYSEEKLLQNINTNNYVYVGTKSNSQFNIIDLVTEYE